MVETTIENYVVVGLATCFIKQEGKLTAVKIAEPVPSAAFEAILKGIPTSYEIVVATTTDALNLENSPLPEVFPADAQWCDDFMERLQATVRSYQSRPAATTHLPLGEVKTDLNYSTERKRMLNSDRIITPEDNVKQHAYTHQVL
ncbi:hypothetical protein GS597_12365 [Synechococcales cyanobacterium C]|uniref:Uncharacterized protein n=1 Tax=Petrachloros mirabilis ULC683 TaxID=2781853 RepID=A0A8K2A8N4_9CYAN|nr:hypothetical protein [Petrachloros mirabilis]NCJ07285.1 hypothetical protein [Petrachloros mirabilis ULC683]